MGDNPQESLENTINAMGTLLGVHPIVTWHIPTEPWTNRGTPVYFRGTAERMFFAAERLFFWVKPLNHAPNFGVQKWSGNRWKKVEKRGAYKKVKINRFYQ